MTDSGHEPLAHSASEKNPKPHLYVDHIRGVVRDAESFAREVAEYYQGSRSRDCLVQAVQVAATYHDLGKLAVENQRVLHAGGHGHLPVNHVDAGTAHLLDDKERDMAAALLVYAHHIGLPSLGVEAEKKGLCLRDPDTAAKTNVEVEIYLEKHRRAIGVSSPSNLSKADGTCIWNRIALSCLVDADHTDTARHRNNIDLNRRPPELRPTVRLHLLDAYVERLGRDRPNDNRNRIRRDLYRACRDAPVEPSIRSCDSPVGAGKTTAIMAHILNVAHAKNLRRVFVVLPFTNIIDQSVRTYRTALLESGEEPEAVVAAHHHRAAFSSLEYRHLSVLWDAPIVVTTAVQFFETLASNRTADLRKLHQVSGSAIFIDEAHAALPAHLWPQAWLWIRELASDWGCHIVLASGSLVRFWTFPEFSDPPAEIPDIVSEDVRHSAVQFESERVQYCRQEAPFNCDGLVQCVLDSPGPRVVVLNTVQSAAVMADAFRTKIGRELVEHISTALCPCDREKTVERVKKRLKSEKDQHWVLVATSCVEAGLDFSFRSAFRESAGLVNLIQLGGRANREAEHSDCHVFDFRLNDPLLPRHPTFKVSADVLAGLFAEGSVGPGLSTEAMRREVRLDPDRRGAFIVEKEKRNDYPEVAKLFRVIDSSTVTVIVDPQIVKMCEGGEKVDWRELQMKSVQIWSSKVRDFPMRPLRGSDELFCWTGDYDDFLGYMAGVLPLLPNTPGAFVV